MVVWVLVVTVWVPVVPSVTYQPLKWVIVGDTSVLLMYGWRVPRSAAVQVSPGPGVCAVVVVGAAAAGEAGQGPDRPDRCGNPGGWDSAWVKPDTRQGDQVAGATASTSTRGCRRAASVSAPVVSATVTAGWRTATNRPAGRDGGRLVA
ncbi:hypothetical protein GCM10010219_14370 [Streptomyces netropsis]|nr:hypothetical protein GCM10010219_14370 [Streptomyces netropsis]